MPSPDPTILTLASVQGSIVSEKGSSLGNATQTKDKPQPEVEKCRVM